ncbi:MAG: hypothetical protein U0234_26240 [Sandaracinus sp.]
MSIQGCAYETAEAIPEFDCSPSLTTNAASYAVGTSFTTSWSCIPAGTTWLTVVPSGSPCPGYNPEGLFTGASTVMGSKTFAGTIGPGTWVARLYSGRSCSLVAETSAFSITASGSASISTNVSTYHAGNSIVVSWSGLPGGSLDWVSVTHPESDSAHYLQYFWTGGAASGTHTIAASTLGTGTFVVNAHTGNTLPILAQSAPFTVDAPVSVTTNAATYDVAAPITFAWALNTAASNYIEIRPASADPLDVAAYYRYFWAPTQTGSTTITPHLPPGRYLAVAYEMNTTHVIATSTPFDVVGAAPSVDAPELLAPMTSFDVRWSGMSAWTNNDWIGIRSWSGAAYPYYSYLGGLSSGTHTFSSLPLTPGRYRVDAFDYNGATNFLVASDEMVVYQPACMSGTVPLPDGTSCGANLQCFSGLCVAVSSGWCGDGVRKPGPSGREGCDDGYTDAGDACDATCHPTALVVAGREGRRDETPGQIPAVAEDGTGRVLFVWLADRVVAGEPTADVVARRFTSAGHPIDAAPIVLEAGVGISGAARPTVAGQAQGWIVSWRSTAAEPSGGAEGGIVARTVSRDGVLGTRRVVNETIRGDQLDPVIARLSTGAVVVWVDRSVDGLTGDLRARMIDTTGRPTGHELAVAADPSLDESRPFVVARGTSTTPSSRWAVAWDGSLASDNVLPEVRLRRFDGATALDAADLQVSHAWGSEVSLAATSTGIYAAWTSRAADARGDVAARFVADGTTTIADDTTGVDHYTATTEPGSPAHYYADTSPAIAAVTGGYVIAYHTTAAPDGGRLARSTGATVAAEVMDLESELLVGEHASLVSTGRGLWATYQNQTATTTATSFVAFLMAGS